VLGQEKVRKMFGEIVLDMLFQRFSNPVEWYKLN
jgi:hypothetical protein